MTTTYSVTRDIYYVYEHVRIDTGKVFYVGKGKNSRAFSKHQRNKHWHSIVNKSGGFLIKFLKQNINEELALFIEIERIDQLKRLGVSLCNYTSGGEGTSGYKHSEEAKQKISAASKRFMTGRKMPPESIKKMIASKVGKKLSEEHKLKIGLASLGRIPSKETIDKRRCKVLGRKNSLEACKNISEGIRRAKERKNLGVQV